MGRINAFFRRNPCFEHQCRVAFIKAQRRAMKVYGIVKVLFSEDPWSALSQLGIRAIVPIPHERNISRPIEVPLSGEIEETVMPDGTTTSEPIAVMTTAYIVGDKSPTMKRKPLSDGEPLGPEDYELGVRVPPAPLGSEEVVALEPLWRRE